MSNETQLDELLYRWEELTEQGQVVTPQTLCSDCPELVDELSRRVNILKEMNDVFTTSARRDDHTDLQNGVPPTHEIEILGYEILSEIGRGGMGVVHKARQTKLNRIVAVKTMLGGPTATQEDMDRFHTEAEAAAKLSHSGIVAIHEVGEANGLHGEKAFVIRRFDRSEDGPIHIEDFAQISVRYPHQKYEGLSYRNIATVLGIETSLSDVAEFIRRLVYSTLIGNDDMHLKNWSLIYYDRRNASLSPAYDLLSTIPYTQGKKAALKYARTKVMADVGLAELAYLADKAKLPEKLVLDTARQTVSDFLEVWAAEKHNLEITADVIDAVEFPVPAIPGPKTEVQPDVSVSSSIRRPASASAYHAKPTPLRYIS